MTQYLVEWTIDIEAADEVSAAKAAREIQLRPDSIANVFVVHQRTATGRLLAGTVDLSEVGK